MVVDGAAFPRTPDENELSRISHLRSHLSRAGIMAYQIALPIALVDEVPRVRPAGIAQRILLPLVVVGDVAFHQPLDIHRVYVVGVETRAGPQRAAEVLDQLVECVEGARRPEGNGLGLFRRCDRCLEIGHAVDVRYGLRSERVY